MIDYFVFVRLGFGVIGLYVSLIGLVLQICDLVYWVVDLGVILFDIGLVYGVGCVEKWLGQVFWGIWCDKVFVCIKVGIYVGGYCDFFVGVVEMLLKESLVCLQIDYVDFLLLYGLAEEELIDKFICYFEVFKVWGMICYFGICGCGVELEVVICILVMDVIMVLFNFELMVGELEWLECCKKVGLLLIGIEVMKGFVKFVCFFLSFFFVWYFVCYIKQFLLG